MHLRTLKGTSGIQLEPHICTEAEQDQETFVYSSVSSVVFAMRNTDMDECIWNLKEKNNKILLANVCSASCISTLTNVMFMHTYKARILQKEPFLKQHVPSTPLFSDGLIILKRKRTFILSWLCFLCKEMSIKSSQQEHMFQHRQSSESRQSLLCHVNWICSHQREFN